MFVVVVVVFQCFFVHGSIKTAKEKSLSIINGLLKEKQGKQGTLYLREENHTRLFTDN